MPAPPDWTEWKSLTPPLILAPAVLAEVLDGGQAFRWHGQPGNIWQGAWAGWVARVRLSPTNELSWSAPRALAGEVASALPHYLAADMDYGQLTDRLPWHTDVHLASCLEAFPGLRLLRQPLGEALLGFLCSATKQIVQIKQMTEALARQHGREIAPGCHRLPTWPELAEVSEKDLRACRLGFRARHIRETARHLARHPGWLEEAGRRPYAEARQRLCELPGVGEKIADCVLLFGAGRLEAFPVDVWILKAMAVRYGLSGWKSAQVAHFGRTHFGPLAGLAQQYLFAWERRFGGRR